MNGTIVCVRIHCLGGETVELTPNYSIWTSGLGDLEPEMLGLGDVPRLVYRREPCWLFYRDHPDDSEDWSRDHEIEWSSSACGLFVPWIGIVEVLYLDSEE